MNNSPAIHPPLPSPHNNDHMTIRTSSIILLTALSASAFSALPAGAATEVSFHGNSSEVIRIDPDRQSGLDAVYVADGVGSLSVSFTSSSPLTWLRYGHGGGAYGEPAPGVTRSGDIWTLANPEGNTGYMIETEAGTKFYFWLVDYSTQPFEAEALSITSTDCSSTALAFTGSAPRMAYTSINGRSIEIDRQIEIRYSTMQWDAGQEQYAITAVEETRPWIDRNLSVVAPLCSTSYTISGDRFLRRWNREEEAVSGIEAPTAVEAHTDAIQTTRDNDNEQRPADSEALGGSAPVEIRFSAAVTEAAIFTEWQMSRYPEFDIVDYSSNDLNLDYTFREAGTTYVRFVAANADGTCDFTSDTYSVFVGESALICPNAFSPGASEGVNDLWKVSYKSLISFECHIFNKWGVKMAELTDPSQGWDGRYAGKLVPAGVYYYVIKATGADGKRYNRSGDINILNYR